MSVIGITNLHRYTFACPSQWTAATEDGREVYIRYRWGELSWGMGATKEDAVVDSFDHEMCAGDGLDGCMETEEMLDRLADVFRLASLPAQEETKP